MSDKGSIIKPAKAIVTNKINSASGKGQPPKRSNTEMSPNVSMEEITVISHQLETLSEDMKNMREDVKSVMKRDEMEVFIKGTVSKIMADINENMELTISLKVEEKTKAVSEKMKTVQSENENLKKDLLTMKSEITKMKNSCLNAEKQSREALVQSNHNEQYSRKNNIKIMDVKQPVNETIEDLTTKVCGLVSNKGLTLDPASIVAIHRIPGKVDRAKPILVKLKNNHEKTKIMRKRSEFKNEGNRLVDDVTKQNAKLIQTLMERKDIEQAWFFNGSIFAKAKGTDRRHKIDLFDDVGKILKS